MYETDKLITVISQTSLFADDKIRGYNISNLSINLNCCIFTDPHKYGTWVTKCGKNYLLGNHPVATFDEYGFPQ
jgi:plastocyanin domain-containing protein